MNKLVSLLLAGLFVCGSGVARDVTSFNTGWQFKKGPFSADAMKAASQWEGKWETVDIPAQFENLGELVKNTIFVA